MTELTEAEKATISLYLQECYACQQGITDVEPCECLPWTTGIEQVIDARLAPIRALADEWQQSTTWDGRIEPVGRACGQGLARALSAPLTAPDTTDGPQGHPDADEAPGGEILPLPVAFREMAEKVPASHLDPLTWRTAMEVAARICEEAR